MIQFENIYIYVCIFTFDLELVFIFCWFLVFRDLLKKQLIYQYLRRQKLLRINKHKYIKYALQQKTEAGFVKIDI